MMYQGKRENRDLFISLLTCQQEIDFDNIFFSKINIQSTNDAA